MSAETERSLRALYGARDVLIAAARADERSKLARWLEHSLGCRRRDDYKRGGAVTECSCGLDAAMGG